MLSLAQCVELQNEIESDKKKRAALQRKMKEESEGRRSEKRAAEVKAMRMLREGEKLKVRPGCVSARRTSGSGAPRPPCFVRAERVGGVDKRANSLLI